MSCAHNVHGRLKPHKCTINMYISVFLTCKMGITFCSLVKESSTSSAVSKRRRTSNSEFVITHINGHSVVFKTEASECSHFEQQLLWIPIPLSHSFSNDEFLTLGALRLTPSKKAKNYNLMTGDAVEVE
jgi:hypothetical protein